MSKKSAYLGGEAESSEEENNSDSNSHSNSNSSSYDSSDSSDDEMAFLEHKMFDRAYLLMKLFLRLLKHLVFTTPKWVIMATRLFMFVICLLPGFVRFFWYYMVSGGVRRDIRYGPASRQVLDVYLPAPSEKNNNNKDIPIVVFVTGGAWIIGYKMWGALLGRALTSNNCMLVIPDYRNFPQATGEEMCEDVDVAVQWVLRNVGTGTRRSEFSDVGSNKKVVLVGQSAGAQLTALVLLKKAMQSVQKREVQSSKSSKPRYQRPPNPRTLRRWSPGEIRGFIPISGPYDLVSIKDFMHQKGLDKKIISHIFPDLIGASPVHVCDEIREQMNVCSLKSINSRWDFPPTCVIHGSEDQTVPHEMCGRFSGKLRDIGVESEAIIYEGWSHTDGILEGPMEGDHRLHRDIFDRVIFWTEGGRDEGKDIRDNKHSFDDKCRLCKPLSPSCMIQIGRSVNPF